MHLTSTPRRSHFDLSDCGAVAPFENDVARLNVTDKLEKHLKFPIVVVELAIDRVVINIGGATALAEFNIASTISAIVIAMPVKHESHKALEAPASYTATLRHQSRHP